MSVSYSGMAAGTPVEPCAATITLLNSTDSLPVNYENNTGPGTARASVRLSGDSDVKGFLRALKFLIGKPTTVRLRCSDGSTYDETAKLCTAFASAANGSILDANLPITYGNNVDAGVATVKATYPGDGDGGHPKSEASGTFTIAKAPSTVTVTCPAAVDYTGAALTPCNAKFTGAGIKSGTTTFTYTDDVFAGTATATGTYTGDPNHLDGTGSATFQVKGFSFTGYSSPVAIGGAKPPLEHRQGRLHRPAEVRGVPAERLRVHQCHHPRRHIHRHPGRLCRWDREHHRQPDRHDANRAALRQ